MWPETPFHGLFDSTVFSCSVGMKKPDPAIYALACEELGVDAADCVYIGDGFSNELSGARSCGMRPFLLAPPDEEPSDSPRCEARMWDGERLSSLSDVIQAVERS